jgi:hypothetical protein
MLTGSPTVVGEHTVIDNVILIGGLYAAVNPRGVRLAGEKGTGERTTDHGNRRWPRAIA